MPKSRGGGVGLASAPVLPRLPWKPRHYFTPISACRQPVGAPPLGIEKDILRLAPDPERVAAAVRRTAACTGRARRAGPGRTSHP